MLGLKVTAIKIDPYMNIDAGTMAPTEHGEVYVLNDGGEADLDLGNYERYLDVTLARDNNITTGKIYREVIEKEVSGRSRVMGGRGRVQAALACHCGNGHAAAASLCSADSLPPAPRRLPRQDGADCAAPHVCDPGLDRACGRAARRRDGLRARRVHRRARRHGGRH
jgi:hypothetical protein